MSYKAMYKNELARAAGTEDDRRGYPKRVLIPERFRTNLLPRNRPQSQRMGEGKVKMRVACIFLSKYLHISKKSSNFAPCNGQNIHKYVLRGGHIV